MDFYVEYMVKHKKDNKAKMCTVGIYALAAVLTIVLFMLILWLAVTLAQANVSQFAFSIGFLLIAATWYGAVFFANKFNIEYEYIVTNGSVDIDKIMSKSQRKRVISFEFADVDICANIKDEAHNSEYKREKSDIKLYDLTGDMADGGVYFADFRTESGMSRVLFQPTSKIMENARRYNPRNIHIYEDRF